MNNKILTKSCKKRSKKSKNLNYRISKNKNKHKRMIAIYGDSSYPKGFKYV